MKSKALLLLLLLAGAGAGGWISSQLSRPADSSLAGAKQEAELRMLQSRLAEAEKERSRLTAELDAALSRVRSFEADSAAISSVTAAKPETPVAAPPKEREEPRERRLTFLEMMEDPDYASAHQAARMGQLDARYSTLFRQLALSPAQLDRFKNLLVEKQTARTEASLLARQEGIRDRDQIRAISQKAAEEVDRQIAQELGGGVLTRYQEYEKTLPQRQQVAQVSQRLSYGATPLNDHQAEELVKLYATASSAIGSRPNRDAPEAERAAYEARQFQANQQLLSQARGLLTPQQVEALARLQADQAAERRLRQLRDQQRRASRGDPAR